MVSRAAKRARSASVSQAERAGNQTSSPPLTNRGGKSGKPLSDERPQLVASADRERLNLSIGPEVKQAVVALARVLGMSESQLVVHALLMSFPALREQASGILAFSQGEGGQDEVGE